MNQGQIISHYTIIRPIGKGGMGEVYLAEDSKLDRQVAIKVLPDAVRSDPERLARFRREAKAAASLNHPNIATVHSIEEDGDIHFIVMEHVDGETLAKHLPSDGIKLDLFFNTFIPLVDALAHAHAQGRIHRDIKPANIMITADGTPKILDFGLARIIDPGEVGTLGDFDSDPASEDETMTMRGPGLPSITGGGQLVGTPHYMSPEQAERDETDARTDIFSLGVVMYEAVSGRRPFEGKTLESVIGKIMEASPRKVTELRPDIPYLLWHVIDNCLRKDRKERTQSARKLHRDLCDVKSEVKNGVVLVEASTIESRTVTPFWKQPAAWSLMVLLVVATALAVPFLAPNPTDPPRLRRFNLPLDAWVSPQAGPVISPDGQLVAFQLGGVQNASIWLRNLAHTESRNLSPNGMRPFFSSDSRFVGYFELESEIFTLSTIPANGGNSTPVCELPPGAWPRGVAWTSEGRMIFGVTNNFPDPAAGRLMHVSAGGGSPEPYLMPDTLAGERGIIHPALLQDGKTLIASITMQDGTGTLAAIVGTQRITLVRHEDDILAFPAFAPSGHLIYQRGYTGGTSGIGTVPTSVWAVGFDVDELAVTGQPFLVTDGTQIPSVSHDGTLLYSAPGLAVPGVHRMIWVDRSGRISGTVGREQARMQTPALSPDGRHVAVASREQGPAFSLTRDIWVHDVVRGTAQRLTTNPMVDQRPVWSSDGTRLGFFSLRSGSGNIYTVPSDGSGSISTLGIDTVSDNEGSTLNDWSSDDRYIIYQSRSDLWYRPVSNDATPVQLTDTPYDEARAQLSPDDQYVVYESNASGQMEIYVTPFPSGKGRWQISVNGGGSPRWNPKSNELFYLSGNEMMAVTVRTDTAFEASIPQVLFQAEGTVAGSSRGGTNYDVSQDGRRFLMLQQVEEGRPGQPVITLIQNWALQNRAPQ